MIADSGYGDATAFRLGLDQRNLSYVVAVKATTSAQPGDAAPVTPQWSGTGRPPQPGYPTKPTTLRELALAAKRRSLHQVTWRHGAKKTPDNHTGAMRSRFLALRVRPANRQIPRGADACHPHQATGNPHTSNEDTLNKALVVGRSGIGKAGLPLGDTAFVHSLHLVYL